MSRNSKDFDLIVFGSNAFTGKLATDYISKKFPAGICWAISGRDPKKLKGLYEGLLSTSNPPKEYFILDHSDRQKVFQLVERTKVALSFAGPFSQYGENIVASCAQHGTHYLDITGETAWVRDMIVKYEAEAVKSGAILIPFSGFDSIPSDLGVWRVLQQANAKNPEATITEVVSLFSARGGINGGTFETFLGMLGNSKSEEGFYGDIAALVPEKLKGQFKFTELRWPIYVKEARLTAPPFMMAPINTRVVYRSQSLRMSRFAAQQLPIRYTELQKLSPRFSRSRSVAMVLGGDILAKIGRFSGVRNLLRMLGPKPGAGPSEKIRNSGYFRSRFFAYSGQTLIAQSEIYFKGDPGNQATITMACESALSLLVDEKRLIQIHGGFWTPSTALGSVLVDRLTQAGFKFS